MWLPSRISYLPLLPGTASVAIFTVVSGFSFPPPVLSIKPDYADHTGRSQWLISEGRKFDYLDTTIWLTERFHHSFALQSLNSSSLSSSIAFNFHNNWFFPSRNSSVNLFFHSFFFWIFSSFLSFLLYNSFSPVRYLGHLPLGIEWRVSVTVHYPWVVISILSQPTLHLTLY